MQLLHAFPNRFRSVLDSFQRLFRRFGHREDGDVTFMFVGVVAVVIYAETLLLHPVCLFPNQGSLFVIPSHAGGDHKLLS